MPFWEHLATFAHPPLFCLQKSTTARAEGVRLCVTGASDQGAGHPRTRYRRRGHGPPHVSASWRPLCYLCHTSVLWPAPQYAIPNLFGTRDWFHGRQSSQGPGIGFRVIQAHYIYYAPCFYYYFISSTLDHQVLDSGGWGPRPNRPGLGISVHLCPF